EAKDAHEIAGARGGEESSAEKGIHTALTRIRRLRSLRASKPGIQGPVPIPSQRKWFWPQDELDS
ncbi:hypothetical protein ACMWQA_27380, partial [Escherichia coli]|uniref:hypothetical protein n=1 Tax=Escherichia coli TaxID=562 RepID=UPI0039DFC4FB